MACKPNKQWVNNCRKQRETKKSALDPSGDQKVPGSNLGEFGCSWDMSGAMLVSCQDIASLCGSLSKLVAMSIFNSRANDWKDCRKSLKDPEMTIKGVVFFCVC
jgi:hypothetical protein